MLHANGLDPEVRRYVMAPPGPTQLVRRNAKMVLALLKPDVQRQWADTPQPPRVDVHVVCGGGQHRGVDRTKGPRAEFAAHWPH